MIFANKIKHLLLGTLIPLFAASTLVLTGFSLWQFDIQIEKQVNFSTQSVEVKKYYENLGQIEINPMDTAYSGYRIIFEEGSEANIADDTKGISLLPEINVNLSDVPNAVEDIPYGFRMSMSITANGCSTDLNEYFYLRGFTIQTSGADSVLYTSSYVNDETTLPQIPVALNTYTGTDYNPLILVDSNNDGTGYGLDNLMITPLFSWKEGMKPQTSDQYGEFLSKMNGNGHGYDNSSCICDITLTIYFGLFIEPSSLNGGSNV